MKFEYWPIFYPNSTEKQIVRPILEVELFSPSDSIIVAALVDSGADECLFNLGYARKLGIDISRGREKSYTGINGPPIVAHIIDLELKVKHVGSKIVMPIAFVDSPNVDALLGQTGFFDSFRIKFEKDHKTFEVTPSPKMR